MREQDGPAASAWGVHGAVSSSDQDSCLTYIKSWLLETSVLRACPGQALPQYLHEGVGAGARWVLHWP